MTIKKGMLFSAGLGVRLRPLTQTNPKPLLPIGNKAIIDYSLFYLSRFGVKEVVINLHHLGGKIKAHVDTGKKYKLKIRYTEEEVLLGTGGGLKKAQSYFEKEEAFFTLNSDTLINCDLHALAQFHFEQRLPATLVVTPWQEGHTRLQIANNNFLNVGRGNHLFTGLAVLTPKIFDFLEERESNLVLDGILPMMNRVKGIAAFEHTGYWRDIGTKESYAQAQEEWASHHHNRMS